MLWDQTVTKRLLRHQSETQNTIPNTSTEKNAQISKKKKNNTLAESVAFRKEQKMQQKRVADVCVQLCLRSRGAMLIRRSPIAATDFETKLRRFMQQRTILQLLQIPVTRRSVHCHSTDPKPDSHHRQNSLSGNQA